MKITFNTVNFHNNHNKQHLYCTNFYGTKYNTVRNIGFAFLASSLLAACDLKIKQNPDEDVLEIGVENNNIDTLTITPEQINEKTHPTKTYYYLPRDNDIDAEQYEWTETKYPDGRIEKDSLGYKISITPEGDRTVIYTDTDSLGNKFTTTELPDGSKIFRTDYLTDMNEKYYEEKIYRPDGSLKESSFYKEYIPIDSMHNNMEKIIEYKYAKYDEQGILTSIDSNINDSIKNEIDTIANNSDILH